MDFCLQDYLLSDLTEDYLDNLFQIYKETYQKRQLDFSVFSGKEMQKKYTGIISIKEKAFFVYRSTNFGKKITLLFSKQDFSSKKALVTHYLNLIQQKNWYIEASGVIEDISVEYKLPFLEDKIIIERILNKTIEWLGNGYYKRKLSKADIWIMKRIYGYPNMLNTK